MDVESRSTLDWERRLSRLEKRERCWRGLAVLAVTTLGVTVLAGSVWNDVGRLDVRELRLVDDHGHPRMLLTLAGPGHPKLLMLEADGQVCAQLTTDALSFEDRGTPQVLLGAQQHLQLYDRDGRRRVELGGGGEGAFLRLLQGTGRGFARIGISNTGEKFVTQSSAVADHP